MKKSEKEQKQIVANSFKDVLESFEVKNIKEIEFTGAYMLIRFASKKSALKARECKILKEYQYDLKPDLFKFKHELIGAV